MKAGATIVMVQAATDEDFELAFQLRDAADAIIKALNDSEFDTVVGKFKFNEKGDPNLPPYAVYRWSDGTYEQIDPPSGAPAG